MSEQLLLRCEDSLEGAFTAIYDAFVYKNRFTEPYTDSIEIAIGDAKPSSLFVREIEIVTDTVKVQKTIKAIRDKMGYAVFDRVLHALCHFHEDRGTWVLGYLVRGFKVGSRIDEYLADYYVEKTFELYRKVYNEIQRLLGFLRFVDTGKFMFAEIEPKTNAIPVMWAHFADRYPNEHFVIYDNRRKFSYVHQAYTEGFFIPDKDLHGYMDDKQDYFSVMWKQYFETMAIDARKNETCQNNLAPKWYRKNMYEFKNQ